MRQRRKDRACRILLTGATGFLGGHLMAALLNAGYHNLLVLARPARGATGAQRVRRLLRWFGIDPSETAMPEVIEGRIEVPYLGSGPADVERLLDVDEIVHCASSTRFSERARRDAEDANVHGLQHVLDVAVRGSCSSFHHISTCYIAGAKNGVCREEIVATERFTNVYEETKYLGEQKAAACCAAAGIRLNIYRPSVVYGDSRTGRSTAFTGLYHPVRTFHVFKNLFQKDIMEHGGKRAAGMGVVQEDGETIRLPVRLRANEQDGINLVPVDYFTAAFMAIRDACTEGGIFHIVNGRTKSIGSLLDYTRRFLALSGIECDDGARRDAVRNPLEVLFDTYNRVYEPYMQDRRTFDAAAASVILKPKGIECPDLDYEVFSRCMEYAVESRWGSALI